MTPAELRAAAAARLARGWTQDAYARTAAGRPIGPTCDNAASWCLYGALHAEMGGLPERPSHERLRTVGEVCDQIRTELGLPASISLGDWNDAPERTQAEVVAAVAGVPRG